MEPTIYTIGHSNHSQEKFTSLLKLHGVNAIADVRSSPRSRIEHFSRERLSRFLKEAGIEYVFLGRELGARPADLQCYQEGRARYDLIARTPLFLAGLSRIAEGASKYTIALMCAEKDPLTCHRTVLVGRRLPLHARISHILADGSIETAEMASDRLLKELGYRSERELFRPREAILEEAFARRAREIEYVDQREAAFGPESA